MELESHRSVLLNLGFVPAKIDSISRNKDALRRLVQMVEASGHSERIPAHQTALLVLLALNAGNLEANLLAHVLRSILDDQISSQTQLTEAIHYFERGGDPDDEAAFCTASGVGIHMTRQDIHAAVRHVLEGHIKDWTELRTVLAGLKRDPQLRWADPAILKEETEVICTQQLGSRPNQNRPKHKAAQKLIFDVSSPASIFEEGFLASLHKLGENPQIHDKLRIEHLKATQGKVHTRFPPEPNGFLHIGHAKAIAVNFGYAKYHGGLCYLRYDDTNPDKEEQIFFDSILTSVRWLGIEPEKVTYSSDYFDTLFDMAVELIKRNKAYVCQCTQEDVEHDRGSKGETQARKECIHRDRPIDVSLAIFEQMKAGHPDVANATLRMKQDLTDPNPQMWDLVAYRPRCSPHPRTSTHWKIYPTYDFAHCLVDSIENISHSLCTTEFVASRQSYEWLCHSLEVYTPRQYEYGRLSLSHTVMSKRHLSRLVQEGQVTAWDDIRLPTLVALRRRGVPPEGIMQFVRGLGVTTAMAVTDLAKFEESIRQFLEPSTPRLFLILHPVKIIIENLSDDFLLMVEKPYHPKDVSMGTGAVPFTRVIYIDAEDFRISGSDDYFRLVPGGTVGLLHVPYPITCTSFEADDDGNIHTIIAHYDDAHPTVKPKAFIHWVAECPGKRSPVRLSEVRLAGPLFQSPNPKTMEVAQSSLVRLCGALIEVGFWDIAKQAVETSKKAARARISSTPPRVGITPITEGQLVGPECVRFQASRVGYFTLDSDSNIPHLQFSSQIEDTASTVDAYGHIVLNRIVSLKKEGESKRVK